MGKERLSDCKLVAAVRKQADHHAGRMFLCAGEILARSWFRGWRRPIRPIWKPPDHHTWYSQNPTLVSSKAEPTVRDTDEKEESGAGSGVLREAQGSVRRRLCVEHLLPVCPEFLEQVPSGAFWEPMLRSRQRRRVVPRGRDQHLCRSAL